MARSALIAATALCLALQLGLLAATHYTDDSDYNDFDIYKDLPEKRVTEDLFQDDFYLLGETEEAEERNRRVASNSRENANTPTGEATSQDGTNGQGSWPPVERVYRYTKHRIPGYDYDEVVLVAGRKHQRCDERSVWTHCVCQFTCAQPNFVDCYTPCTSGCECREDYVYDERAGECVPPEQCQPEDYYLLY